MPLTISIVAYGGGNLGSIRNMLKRIGVATETVSRPADIARATKIILPGVGTFDRGINKIRDQGLVEVLHEKALEERVPILGICLGMQLICAGSDEGTAPGLGWIGARAARFSFDDDSRLKVPHMGWNALNVRSPHPLVAGLGADPAFYFVHSYYVPADPAYTVATAHHGHDFAAVIARDNIVGAQFHPEKSHKFGLCVLQNFAEMV